MSEDELLLIEIKQVLQGHWHLVVADVSLDRFTDTIQDDLAKEILAKAKQHYEQKMAQGWKFAIRESGQKGLREAELKGHHTPSRKSLMGKGLIRVAKKGLDTTQLYL